MDSVFIWAIIAIVLVVLDVITSAFLFSWFSIGALAAMIGNLFGVSTGMQIIIFLVVGILSAIICYPIVKKKFKIDKNQTKVMEEEYIGKILNAEEDIAENDDNARIKVGGVYWAAINTGREILKNQSFEITGIQGTKLVIKKK